MEYQFLKTAKEGNVGILTISGDKVTAKVARLGFYTKIDLGIVKYHFEVGAGKGKEVWK